ncbi:MAG: hypothetical protein ABMA00_03410 [Gemmatimonas sp.]
MSPRRGSSLAGVVALLGACASLHAQPLRIPHALSTPRIAPPTANDPDLHASDRIAGVTHAITDRRASALNGMPARSAAAPWWAPVASGLLPGSGQFAMGQQRAVAYLVAEGYLVLQALSAQRDGNRDRNEYRGLASDVARRPFSATRPDGAWGYYEAMEKYLESGVFDRIPGGAVDPETNPTTFNGARWKLARETYWANPDSTPSTTSSQYQRALASYAEDAVRDEFRWSWRDAQLQKDVYEQTIRSANRRYQRATNMLGLVYANHLTSLIDAYVTVRVRRFGGVRVAGLRLDGVQSAVHPVGDPAAGRRQFVGVLRFVPSPD